MKKRTMKKALSLFLAVLMIALAIPFTMLSASAEVEPSIVGATIKGYFPETDKNRVMAFQSSNPGTNIYDGKIGTDAESEAYNSKENAIKNSYFDANGKFGYEKNEAVDGGYYHVIFLELNEWTEIDKLHLWADSGRQSEWACPNGYDIWYSVDGETYTNTGLSFSGIRNNAEVNPDIYADDTWTQPDGKKRACIAHHIDMDGVLAKYIAIAVTDFAYGSSKGQSIIYEATVDGTVVDAPVALTPNVVGATIGGYLPENDKNTKMYFQSNNPGSNIYDGDITTDAESGAYTSKANAIKNSYFDANGKFGYEKNEAVDGGYYHVIFLELNEWTEIDKLHLWADSGRQSEWACPNGYDIWYSVDGETYTNTGLSFSGIRNNAEVNPDIYADDTWTQPDGKKRACIAHHIDMDGVLAKYIAIAVTDFAYGSGSGQSIIYEVTVDGTVVDKPDLPDVSKTVKFTAANVYAQNGSGNNVGWGSGHEGSYAFDGILHEDNYSTARNASKEMTRRAYFNESGEIAFKDDADYYGIVVAELNMLAELNTLTVWSPNGLGGNWIDNVSYDIYYSVDGNSFALVEGATIADSREVLEGVSVDEFDGDATICNDDGVIYRNVIDMKGVEAKYIAIAVKETIPHEDGRKQIVLYELTLDATPAEEKMMSLVNGASVRMDEPTGLRFTGLVNKDYLDGLRAENDNVTVGMLITPKDYLVDNGLAFTKEALDACEAITGKAYLEIDATTILTDGDNYKVNCAIVNVNSDNYGRAFSAILYIKIDGEIVEYSDFNDVFNSRSVSYVAEKAYSDLADNESTEYANEVTVGDVVKYSPYTEEQRKVLADFFQ